MTNSLRARASARGISHSVRSLLFAGVLVSTLLGQTRQSQAQDSARAMEQEARSLFEAGALAYNAGRYEEALQYFQRSYELSGRVALLYNIGTAAERVREDDLALRSYTEYLERMPEAENRPRVEARIEFLRQQLEQPPPAEDQAEDQAADDAPEEMVVGASLDLSGEERSAEPNRTESGGGTLAPVGWSLLGLGAAAVAVGGVLLGIGLTDQQAVEDPSPGARWENARESYERGPALLTSSAVLLPLGAAIAAAGLVLGVMEPNEDDATVARARVRLTAGGLSIEGAF